MNSTARVSHHVDRWMTISAISYCLLFAPILGCSDSENPSKSPAEPIGTSTVLEDQNQSEKPDSEPDVSGLEEAWHTVTETTESGLTVVSEKCSVGTQMVVDASKAAWIWSSDKTVDGWGWIVDNAGDATEWTRDAAGEAWTVTQEKSGEFSLWVQVKTESGVAWARTSLPAAWNVTKDAAGNAFVWIDEHKVEVAVAAAVVAVVVAGLIVAPEGVAPAIVKGAVAGTAAETTRFLTEIWKGRDNTEHRASLQDVSHDLFMSIGKSVLTQCGAQALGSVAIPAAEA